MLTELESSHEAFLLVQSSALWIKRFVRKLRRQVRVCGNLEEDIFVDDSMLGRCIEDLLKRQSCDVKESCFFFFFIEKHIAGKKDKNKKRNRSIISLRQKL